MTSPNINSLKAQAAQQEAAAAAERQRRQTEAAGQRPLPSRQMTAQTRESMAELNKGMAQQAAADQAAARAAAEREEKESAEAEARWNSEWPHTGVGFDTPEFRRSVEARCDVLDIGSMLHSGRCSQVVEVLPGNTLNVEYQSLKSTDVWALEREVHRRQLESGNTLPGERWFNLARCVLAVKSINGRELTPCLHQGTGAVLDPIDWAKFDTRFAEFLNYAEQIVELVILNKHWFDIRVKRLWADDYAAVKNG